MDCTTARPRIHELLEGALARPEESELRRHLEVCAPCRRERRLLASMAERVARLPRLEAPPEVRARVLAALGLRARPAAAPAWLRWAEGAALGCIALWTAAVSWAAASWLTPARLARAVELLTDASELALAARLAAARSAAGAADLLNAARLAGDLMAPGRAEPALPFQLAAATLLAAAVLAAVPRRDGAARMDGP